MRARFMRYLIVALGLVLTLFPWPSVLSAASTTCDGPQPVNFLTAGDSATKAGIVAIACTTSTIRFLKPKNPVGVRLVAPDALRAAIVQAAQADIAAQTVASTGAAFQLLGAMATNEDLVAIERGQYSTTSAANYDTRGRILYVRLSKTPFTPLDRAMIAHEYTRALQDQYFGLSSLLSNTPGPAGLNSDAQLARQAVVEGDAITTMLNYAATFSRQDQVDFNKQLQRLTPTPADFAHDRSGFPADQGTTFVKYLMSAAAKGKKGSEAAGASATAVNRALANPPATTREVLNPGLYLKHLTPPQALPAPRVSLGAGWQEVNSDVLGAFAIDDMMSQHGAPASTVQAAASAAAAWQGDRWVMYQQGNQTVLVWRAHFDSAAGAQAFSRAFLSATASRFRMPLNATNSLDWHANGFAISLRLRSSDVAMALASSPDLQNACITTVTQLGFK